MNYTIQQIAELTQGEIISNHPQSEISHIYFDTRVIFSAQNSAFIALNTSKNSGEKFIQNAIDKGIKTIITSSKENLQPNINYIIVKNTLTFLQNLATIHRKNFKNIKNIGITGSNGKTIVKEWLYQCLAQDFDIVKSPKSFNSQIGLALSLLQIENRHQIGIFEAGISNPQEMNILEKMLEPEIGIFTHLGSAHLSNFENENQLIEEKLLLFKNSKLLIFNGDNPLLKEKINQFYPDKKTISYGFQPENDLVCKKNKNQIEIDYQGLHLNFDAQKINNTILYNIFPLIILMKKFNFDAQKINTKIKNLKNIEMRLESVEGTFQNLIINDSYNLDLDSLLISYQYISQYNKKNNILILTDFIENQHPESLYPKVAELTNEKKFDMIFFIGEEIIKYQHLFSCPKIFHYSNVEDLIKDPKLNHIKNSLILLKGARKFKIEKIKIHLELQKHDTSLEINLNKILHNINIHKDLLKPKTKIMAMVKAHSYGLGSYEIAEFLQHHHIDYFAVAYTDEGVELLNKGITQPIMIMNPEERSHDTIIEHLLEPEIYNFRMLHTFCQKLKDKGYSKKYPIHIKLETGMNRLGFKNNEIPELIEKIKTLPVEIKSIFSHLSCADVPNEKEYTMQQIEIFDKNSKKIIHSLPYKPLRHILNSAGIVNFTDFQYDMVRIGIGMMGLSSNPKIQKKLENVIRLKSIISQIFEIKQGESVSYGRNFIAEKDTKIATIPLGYADGIPRILSNGKGFVKIQNTYLPIIGNICMDMLMVDLGQLNANEGDEVILFDSIEDLENIAKKAQTIPYEILTSISRRVKRIYIKD